MSDTEKLWVIGDTHFFHTNIIQYTSRPKDFVELIAFNWTRLVLPEDWIVHLGDVGLGRFALCEHLMSLLPGRKILIRGNHDRRLERMRRLGFEQIFDRLIVSIDNALVVLTHRPMRSLDMWSNVINIHGHIHNKSYWQLWYINGCVELQNYAPVRLVDLVRPRLKLIRSLYLKDCFDDCR